MDTPVARRASVTKTESRALRIPGVCQPRGSLGGFVFLALTLCVAVGRPAASSQTGWLLISPPVDQEFVEVFYLLEQFRMTPSETAREEIVKKHPMSERVKQRLQWLSRRLIEEKSRERRGQILSDAMFDRDAPLVKWEQLSAYDSAQHCEESRLWLLERALEEQALAELHVLWLRARFKGAKCVPGSAVFPPRP